MNAKWSADYLRLLLQNIAANMIGDEQGLQGSKSPGNLYLSLHTAEPIEAQSSSEATFGAYRRLAVPRTSSAWKVEQDDDLGVARGMNTAILSFPEATSGQEKITHVGLGASFSGPGKLITSAKLKIMRPVAEGIVLTFKAGEVVLVEK